MDYRTAAQDVGQMTADDFRNYFRMDKQEGTMPDNSEDYFNPKQSKTSEAINNAVEMTNMNGPDDPSAEPGTAPGAAKDYSEFRDKYGLDFNEDHSKMKSPGSYSRSSGGDGFASDDGAIFTESGVYVGTAKGSENEDGDTVYDNYDSLRSASEGIKTDAEGKGFSDFSSLSDVAGAVHWLTKGNDEPASAPAKAKEKVQSYTLSKARAYTEAYEDEARPNFGSRVTGNYDSNDFLNKYKLNLKEQTKGKTIYKDGQKFDPSPNQKVAEEEAAVMGAA